MIEIKLSQGAKPGHGGILPAEKNTSEIARIRSVTPHIQINSPATHSTFYSPIELVRFIAQLRDLSDGKPIGFKLAIGRKSEFVAICKAMAESGIFPDFITVDGGEGGTGAAPLEYTNSIGMPLVAHYHAKTVCATAEIIASAGICHTSELNRTHIYRRISQSEIKRYDQIFPYLRMSSLLGDSVPDPFILIMQEASSGTFTPYNCLTRIDDVCSEVDLPVEAAVN